MEFRAAYLNAMRAQDPQAFNQLQIISGERPNNLDFTVAVLRGLGASRR